MNTPHRIAYADEAYWNQGRYRSVAAISLPKSAEAALTAQARRLLADSSLREFAWKKLRDARYGFGAKKLIDLTVGSLAIMRVNVLVWDVEDTRHARQGRDDLANLERMYYWLFKTMGEAHPSVWTLRPDEHSAINWTEAHEVLVNSSRRHNRRHDSFEELSRKLEIQRLSPASSDHPLVQVADLFAGLTSYSRGAYDRYDAWLNRNQLELVPREGISLSKSDLVRCDVLSHFDQLSKKNRLQVSLASERGLRTKSPRSPINVWWWTPQHGKDAAPLRAQRKA